MLDIITVCKQIILIDNLKSAIVKWNIENIIMLMIKDLQMYQILALNNPQRIDMSLKKGKPNRVVLSKDGNYK